MGTARRDKLEAIFERALALPPERRPAFLHKACSGDAALRSEVDARLSAYEDAPGSFERLAVGPARSTPPAAASGEDPYGFVGRTLSHYQILEKLGDGGMGVLYRALDLRLGRTAALKFLPPELRRDAQAFRRFMREAQAASALEDEHICTIYEIDETEEGQPFIAMAYYEGETLEDRIRQEPLSLPKALDVVIQITEGLTRAHEAGIVHRDIKPANVMVTNRGVVKILDFGIAKMAHTSVLTQTGATMGTVPYMSPEQVRGDEIDHRSDIWSLGVVLYEMLTGERPFKGEYEQAVLYSILHEEPQPVSQLRPEVPAALQAILARALAKKPQDRYERTRTMLTDLRRVRARLVLLQRFRGRRRRVLLSGLHLRYLALAAAAAAALALVVVLGFFALQSDPGERNAPTFQEMVVVLPFRNLGAPEDDYFADGITGEITSRLASVRKLRVISHTSAIQYSNTTKSTQQIGKDLGVDYVLGGTVQWDRGDGSDRVRVIPYLVRVADDTQVWSAQYDKVLEDIFAVQEELAKTVIHQLDIRLQRPERRALAAKPTEHLDAYDAYLMGQNYMNRAGRSGEYVQQATRMFERAVQLDPGFAQAYAELSQSYARLYRHFHEPLDLARARDAVERALSLDRDLPEAHLALGYYYYWGLEDYDQALEAFARAEERLPADDRILDAVALIRRRQGDFEAAAEKLEEAHTLNPLDARLAFELGHTYMVSRRYPDAAQAFDRAVDLAPGHEMAYLLKTYNIWLWKGDLRASRATLEAVPDGGHPRAVFFWYWQELFEGNPQAALDRLAADTTRLYDLDLWIVPQALLEGFTRQLRGNAARARTAYEEACRLLEGRIRAQPAEDPRLHSALGLCYAMLGAQKKAVREGKRAVEMRPVTEDALAGAISTEHLARIYAVVGEHDAAVDRLEQLLSMPSYLSSSLLRFDPRWDLLRHHPRFQRLLDEDRTGL